MNYRFCLSIFFCVALAGCVSDVGSFDVTLADDAAAVTDGSGERLCQLTIDGGEPLPLTAVEVWLSPPGGTTSVMPWIHEDNDGDGMLSAGDVLTVSEPPVNLVGTADVGTMYSVQLLEDLGSMRVSSLWEGIWTAS